MIRSFDYIIAGAGAAGLSLVIRMIRSEALKEKTILLVDRQQSRTNDRTWCFWERDPDLFEPLIYKSWDRIAIRGPRGKEYQQAIYPYQYKLLRGIDFYDACLKEISKHPAVTLLHADITGTGNESGRAWVEANGERYDAEYVFNSLYNPSKPASQSRYFLLQHFRGWMIETTRPVFQPTVATLMDFQTSQINGLAFHYIMPFEETKALVEYTLFSPALLADAQYDHALREFCQTRFGLDESSYRVVEVENGMIPMTDYRFPAFDGNIIHIGTAGGQTRPSSGYTFRFIQSHSKKITAALINQQHPGRCGTYSRRSDFFDGVLLRILSDARNPGATIFTRLFGKNDFRLVLKFLDRQTTLKEEIRMISKLPVRLFTYHAVRYAWELCKKKSSKL